MYRSEYSAGSVGSACSTTALRAAKPAKLCQTDKTGKTDKTCNVRQSRKQCIHRIRDANVAFNVLRLCLEHSGTVLSDRFLARSKTISNFFRTSASAIAGPAAAAAASKEPVYSTLLKVVAERFTHPELASKCNRFVVYSKLEATYIYFDKSDLGFHISSTQAGYPGRSIMSCSKPDNLKANLYKAMDKKMPQMHQMHQDLSKTVGQWLTEFFSDLQIENMPSY